MQIFTDNHIFSTCDQIGGPVKPNVDDCLENSDPCNVSIISYALSKLLFLLIKTLYFLLYVLSPFLYFLKL
jgi:hypothetical protein